MIHANLAVLHLGHGHTELCTQAPHGTLRQGLVSSRETPLGPQIFLRKATHGRRAQKTTQYHTSDRGTHSRLDSILARISNDSGLTHCSFSISNKVYIMGCTCGSQALHCDLSHSTFFWTRPWDLSLGGAPQREQVSGATNHLMHWKEEEHQRKPHQAFEISILEPGTTHHCTGNIRMTNHTPLIYTLADSTKRTTNNFCVRPTP